MSNKNRTIETNIQEIESLKAQHRSRMSKLADIKDVDEFMEENRQITALLVKANELEKKNKFLDAGLGANGVPDGTTEYKFIE